MALLFLRWSAAMSIQSGARRRSLAALSVHERHAVQLVDATGRPKFDYYDYGRGARGID